MEHVKQNVNVYLYSVRNMQSQVLNLHNPV